MTAGVEDGDEPRALRAHPHLAAADRQARGPTRQRGPPEDAPARGIDARHRSRREQRLRRRAAVTGGQGHDRGGDRGEQDEQPSGEDGVAAAQQSGASKRNGSGTAEAEGGTGGLDQLSAGGIALVAFLGQRSLQDVVERGIGQPRRLLLHVCPQRLRLALAAEGRRAGEAFVEHAGQRVAVRATVDRVAADLLGGHVVQRCRRADRSGSSRRRPAW